MKCGNSIVAKMSKRKQPELGDSQAIEYMWGKMVDPETGTITVTSLSEIAKQHDMSRPSDTLAAFIAHFATSVTSGMTKEEFTDLFHKTSIALDANGQIVT